MSEMCRRKMASISDVEQLPRLIQTILQGGADNG